GVHRIERGRGLGLVVSEVLERNDGDGPIPDRERENRERDGAVGPGPPGDPGTVAETAAKHESQAQTQEARGKLKLNAESSNHSATGRRLHEGNLVSLCVC